MVGSTIGQRLILNSHNLQRQSDRVCVRSGGNGNNDHSQNNNRFISRRGNSNVLPDLNTPQ